MNSAVIVIGAGPAGLATAACLKKLGVACTLLDRDGVTGGAYSKMYEGMTLASPAAFMVLPGLAWTGKSEYTTVPEYREYLARYVAHHDLAVAHETVERVEKRDDGFLVVTNEGEREARAVVVATGMWDFPRKPELPGTCDATTLHAREWRGAGAFAKDARILIVGGATSAVEIAEELGREGRSCIVAARSGVKLIPQRLFGRDLQAWFLPFEHVPTWMMKSRCDTQPTIPASDLGFTKWRKKGLIDVRSALTKFEGREAIFKNESRAEIDVVVFATGYRYDTPFLPSDVKRATAGHVICAHGESISWSGLFVVGAPCAARLSSEFLRGVMKDAQDVAARIAANPDISRG